MIVLMKVNIDKVNLFFFSTEGYSPELPVECEFVRRLRATNDREAILIKCSKKIKAYNSKYLVLVPKHKGVSLLGLSEDPVFTYVLNGAEYKDMDDIDLSPGHKIIIDWGGVTTSLSEALKWQVRRDEI